MKKNRLFYVATCYSNGRPTGRFETFADRRDANANFKGEGKEIGMNTLRGAETELRKMTRVDPNSNTLEWL